MEHVRSTLTTTAVAVLGLVAAAQILHPRDSAADAPRSARSMQTEVSVPAWTDPPGRTVHVSVPASIVPPTDAAELAAAPAGPRVQTTAALTAAMPMTTAPLTLTPPMAQTARAEAPRRRKAVQTVARRTHATRVAASERPANPEAPQGAAETRSGFDPIGDLLRGLGVGRDG